MSVDSLVQGILFAWNNRDGSGTASALDVRARDPKQATVIAAEINKGANLAAKLGRVEEPVRSALVQYLRSCALTYAPPVTPGGVVPKYRSDASEEDAATAANYAIEAAKAFLKYIPNAGTGIWWLPVCNTLLIQLRFAAYMAEDVIKGTSSQKYLNQVHEVLSSYASDFARDRNDWAHSKKQGSMFVTNHSFKVFFRMNKISMCKNLVRNMQEFKNSWDSFPASQAVTFTYYLGRLNIIDELYDEAERNLDYSVSRCLKSHGPNKARILNLLVPVKLLQGKAPSQKCLEYVPHLAPIADAVCSGNVRALDASMEENEELFIKEGLYFLFEKLKALAYRKLFKLTYLANKLEADPSKAHLVPLTWLLTAARLYGNENMDMDELECIVANIIASKRLKGYISHGKMLILSKENPFPK